VKERKLTSVVGTTVGNIDGDRVADGATVGLVVVGPGVGWMDGDCEGIRVGCQSLKQNENSNNNKQHQ
jgi:hypothetical protein